MQKMLKKMLQTMGLIGAMAFIFLGPLQVNAKGDDESDAAITQLLQQTQEFLQPWHEDAPVSKSTADVDDVDNVDGHNSVLSRLSSRASDVAPLWALPGPGNTPFFPIMVDVTIRPRIRIKLLSIVNLSIVPSVNLAWGRSFPLGYEPYRK